MGKKDPLQDVDETVPGFIPDPSTYVGPTPGGERRARTFSEVIAEATRGVDAGMNRFTPQPPDLSSSAYKPDWRGKYGKPPSTPEPRASLQLETYGNPADIHPLTFQERMRMDMGSQATLKFEQAGTLYAHRPVLNAAQLHAWAAAAGIPNLVPPEEMHVTTIYSRGGVPAINPRRDTVIVKRHLAPLGDKGAFVLHFDSPDLQEQHAQARAAGATHDWPSFQTHVTLSYDTEGKDLSGIAPPDFPLEFGPEKFAPINDGWARGKGLKKDYNPDEPRDEIGRWTDGGGSSSTGSAVYGGAKEMREKAQEDLDYEEGYSPWPHHRQEPEGPLSGAQFASPSITDKDFAAASEAIHGERHMAFARASSDIDSALGMTGVKQTDAVGAWADGAENSTMVEIRRPTSMEALRLSAAMKGSLANQKAVLVFQTDPKGSDSLYQLALRGEPAEVHDALLKAGIPFHTLDKLPGYSGDTGVTVVDTDGSLHQKIGDFAAAHNTLALEYNGHAEFLGDSQGTGSDAEQRQRAQEAYAKVIDGAASSYQGRTAQQVWQGVRDRWADRIQALKRAAFSFYDRLAMRKGFDPSEPRDDAGRWTDGGGTGGSSGDKPPSERQFYSHYVQHIDVRGRSGNALETRDKVMREGFRTGQPGPFTVNAGTPTRPGDEANPFMRQYTPQKGDVVYLAPKGAWKDTGNGPAIAHGWRPKPYEAIHIQDDEQRPMYERYLEAFNAHKAKA